MSWAFRKGHSAMWALKMPIEHILHEVNNEFLTILLLALNYINIYLYNKC